jgi:hypothetical protein
VGKRLICSQHHIELLQILWLVSKIQESVGTHLGIGLADRTVPTDRLHAGCSQQTDDSDFCSENININLFPGNTTYMKSI